MKRKIQNVIYVFITLILLFSIIPLGVIAEESTSTNENVTLDSSTALQTDSITSQSENISSVETTADQTVPVNTNDVAIEVTLSATGNLKTDVNKAMIAKGISDYADITSLKINAGPGVKITTAFICDSLVNLRKLDLSNVTETSFPSATDAGCNLMGCENLEEVIFQDGAILSEQMLRDCSSLKSINLSNVDPNLKSGIFMGCTSLEEVILPYGAKTSYKMFTSCKSLKSIDLSNADPKIGFGAFEGCTNLEKVILPSNTVLLGFTFNSCKLLDDINWDAIKGFSNDFTGWNYSDFKGCAFDFSKGYPFPFWTDSNNSSNSNQVPKLYFSLTQTSYEVEKGAQFTLPTPIFKTKSGTNYSDLDKYKKLYASWLDQGTSFLNKMTYKTTINYEGQVVNSIDTSLPGNYEITYNLLSTTNADCHTLTCNVKVIDSTNPEDPSNSGDQVTGIYLDRTNATMSPGSESLLLTATIEPEGIQNKTVIWSSSNESIATVNESGRVTAVKDGICTITATIEGYTATCQITVKSTVNPSNKTDVKFTGRYQDGFKANSLSAERIGNKIVFNLDYNSIRNCDYSFFSPPNGSIIMKMVKNGIKSGSNTVVLELTMAEFKKVLESSSITMNLGFDNRASWINFKTAQLSSLATEEELDNISDDEPDSDYAYTDIAGGVSITKYTGSDHDVVIPNTLDGKKVLEIGVKSFASNNSITNLTIPDSVTSIGICSFESCTSLTTINIPNSVTTIGNSAFYKCSSLKTIKLPDSVSIIGPQAFEFCSSLATINIPDSVTAIELATFMGCSNLSNISIPNYVTRIGRAAFDGCSILTNIDIPDSVTEIGLYAFDSCSSLSSIKFNSSDTNIYADVNTIPQKTTIIGYNPSTAKNYAEKFGKVFKEIENTEKTLPSSISLNKANLVLNINASEKLSPSLSPNDTTDKNITWTSSNSDIATVDSNGNVEGIEEGTAIITATTSNKLTAKCTITVKKSTVIKTDPSITYQTHVQDVGWQDWKTNGDTSGTYGRSLRLEGIKIKLNNNENLGVTYQTHIQNIGWEANTDRGWKSDGDMSGTYGQSLRLEAIQIKLTGADADKYDIYYQVHAQNIGWMGWAKNGENAGTAGYSYRLEGIRILILEKGSSAPSDNVTYSSPFKENNEASYAAILQEYRTAEASGYSYDVIKNLSNVNTELNASSYKTKLYYFVEDISGDNSPELVIAMYNPKYNNSVHPSDFQIYDAYRLNNGVPERIFDINSMGYRAIYTICENQIIRCYGSGGVNAHGDTFYKLDGNNTSTIQTVTYDKPYYILNDAKNNNRTITKTEADKIINSYAPRTDINWIKL